MISSKTRASIILAMIVTTFLVMFQPGTSVATGVIIYCVSFVNFRVLMLDEKT